MSLQRVLKEIHRSKTFLITTHINPDGDGLGSGLALAHALRGLGKQVAVVHHGSIPAPLTCLPQNGLLKPPTLLRARGWADACLIALDCADLERTGLFSNGRIPPRIINIDHHVTNRQFGHINWVEAEASATGELIYRLLRAMEVKLTPAISTCLYVSLLTETGGFRYSNTTPEVLRFAATLVQQGADPGGIAQYLYESNRPGRLRLLGHLLLRIKRSRDQRIAWVTITPDLYAKTGTTADDTEEFVNHPRSLHGVEVALLFRPTGLREWKVSLRAKGRVDVAAVAAQFGGGGHRKAAGCTVRGTQQSAERKVLSSVRSAVCRVS